MKNNFIKNSFCSFFCLSKRTNQEKDSQASLARNGVNQINRHKFFLDYGTLNEKIRDKKLNKGGLL